MWELLEDKIQHGKNSGDVQEVENYLFNHKNYIFLACDWFKKVLFSTNSLAKLLSDSLLSDSLLSDSSTNQSNSKLWFKSTNHNLGFNHYRNSVQTPKFMHPLSVF